MKKLLSSLKPGGSRRSRTVSLAGSTTSRPADTGTPLETDAKGSKEPNGPQARNPQSTESLQPAIASDPVRENSPVGVAIKVLPSTNR